MKNINKIFVILVLMTVFSPMKAQKYYDDQWKKIEDNYNKGTYKSNLPLILNIQNQAIKDANTSQLIKSLKAEFSIVNQTQDDTKNDSASQFFAKLKTMESHLKGEEKLLFKVLLVQFFEEFYNNNSWEINERTNLNNQDFSQIESWSKLDFKNFISENYSELEKSEAALKSVKMQTNKKIFVETENLEYFPTLSDWYQAKYIDFLKDDELFTPNELKANHPKILEIYSAIISQNSGNPKLYFQHQKLNYDCGFTNCKNRLSELQNLYNSPTDGDYKVLIAEDIAEKLTENSKNKEALDFIVDVMKQYPKSKFISNLQNKENAIINPAISIHYEQETQSNKPIHIVAEAKNVEQFSLNIYQVKDDFLGFLGYAYQKYNHPFSSVKKTLVRKETFELKNLKDYKTHKTALEVKPLPSGIYLAEYVVDGSVQQDFYFLVSDSKIIFNKKKDRNPSENQYQLVNSDNGKTLANENIEFYEFLNRKSLGKTSAKTNEKGILQFPKSAKQEYYRYFLVKNSGNNYNLLQLFGREYSSYNEDQMKKLSQIFLDRAIYRPGQTVYFKVICTQLLEKKESVLSGEPQEIALYDANDEKISSQKFTTNSFGSYNGSFTLPKGKLNGEFSLRIENKNFSGYKDFKVEEYKRPKFEVTFEPVKGEYKYGETLKIHGKAMSFSGIPLNDTHVNYEIKKHNIRWMYFWWFPHDYNDNENSILGEVKTNEKGEFTIKVDLKKDETLEGIQVDNYEINASVTDINGETQSADTNVKVASVSHYIDAKVLGNIFTDEDTKLKVETKNYNDQDLKKPYHVKLSKLIEPNQIFRENFQSEIQDLPVFSKEEFLQKFPHDFYDKKDDAQNLKVEKVIYDKEVQPNSDNLLEIFTNSDERKQGTYQLELYNIEGKDTIKVSQNFKVWSKNGLGENQKPFLEVMIPKTEFKHGEKAKIYVYSAIPDALVGVFVQNGNGETQYEQKNIKNGILVYEVPIPADESISKINVQFQMVAFNDVQTKSVDLKITENQKPLRIETTTFRDKIQPNSKEKWSIKVIGNDNEIVNAEVLANMYDKSLDQFAGNSYHWQKLYTKPFMVYNYHINNGLASEYFSKRLKYLQNFGISVPDFNWFDERRVYGNKVESYNMAAVPVAMKAATMEAPLERAKDKADYAGTTLDAAMVGISDNLESVVKTSASVNSNNEKNDDLQKVKVRQNLNETAFFYPNLITDKEGNVSFEFTSPEALTKWKLMFLAHTTDAQSAVLEKEVITQKEFSVTPNYPRFLREGDELNLQSKLSNLTTQQLNGSATLQILDAFTNEDISSKFNLNEIQKSFSLNANGNTVANWKVKVPNNVSSIIFKIVAKAGNYSDGEQKDIAVLPNRMLVTDALPIFVKEGQTKTFVLENLKSNNSKTVSNFANTLELTTNPIWEIMFALPSLKDEQNNSADVVFNKWFADVLASEIFKANPKMKTVFDEYQAKGLLSSNLEKNQELKQLLLEETPWVLESKNETEQMQKLARIFDANSMRNSITTDWSELVKLQNSDGGFSWYQGYPSSYYTSLYILKNLGRINEWLKGNLADYQSSEQKEMVSKLVKYLDNEVYKYWDVKKEYVWNNYVLDYLDTRHYWEKDYPLKNKGLQLKNLVINKAQKADIKDFTFFGLHRAALLFDAYNLKNVSKKLITYLKETSTPSETQGVYWKQNLNDWGWYSAKAVNQAGALEAFQKLTPNDVNFIEEIKIWLVTQKEVNSWGSSRGTAEVIYTILNSGKSWTSNESDKAEITWGNKLLNSENSETKNFDEKIGTQLAPSPSESVGERLTGYFKKSIHSDTIDKNLATVTIKKDSPGIVQGGLFWQYYEDLDKIKSSENYISITKELYKKVKTENGEILQKISENAPLKVGDKVTVRMILNTDRNMEFIHLKDMRAAGFEPLNVISGYEWKNNLGYYQSTKDASTNFYIEYMPKGKYVFEYDYVCNASGTFSNGITTLQNYYAPQMNAHTQGTKVKIEE